MKDDIVVFKEKGNEKVEQVTALSKEDAKEFVLRSGREERIILKIVLDED